MDHRVFGDGDRRVETQEPAPRWHRPGTERTADDVEGVAQPVAGARLVVLGPEEGEQTLTGAAQVPAYREHGKDRLGPALGKWGRRAGGAVQRKASEHPEPEHADR